MDYIHHNLTDSLRRINFIFQNEIVLTDCLREYEGIDFLGYKLNSFQKGKKYNLPFFLAAPLIKNNILEVFTSDKCDHLDVQRYAINEGNEQKLFHQEQKFLYNKIKEFKAFIKNDVKNGYKTNMALDNYNSYFLNIIDTRLLKLMKLINSQISLDDEKRITLSEKVLVDIFSKMVKTFRNYFLGISDSTNSNDG